MSKESDIKKTACAIAILAKLALDLTFRQNVIDARVEELKGEPEWKCMMEYFKDSKDEIRSLAKGLGTMKVKDLPSWLEKELANPAIVVSYRQPHTYGRPVKQRD